MKNSILIFLVLFNLFLSCSNLPEQSKTSKKSLEQSREATNFSNQKIQTDSSQLSEIVDEEVPKCSCQKEAEKVPHHTDLGFSGKEFNVDTLLNWDADLALEVKSITLTNFKVIPHEFSKFKNVETFRYSDRDTLPILGLEVFPRLKNLELREAILNLRNSSKWLKNIKAIHAQKSRIIGLKTFNQLPNLISFRFYYSGFDKFPSDFEDLQCLKFFQIGAYSRGIEGIDIHGTKDLRDIDLSKMPCLKFVEFNSWGNDFKGLPQGMGSVEKVKVHHANLTEEEKLELKRK